ncbi:MAG: hypothetical protein K8T10_02855 [Candidatus Eremiobacteraeota bacterium]|nr:hypothetical protein [Candidatus Eremiobacteraeota bacterium]
MSDLNRQAMSPTRHTDREKYPAWIKDYSGKYCLKIWAYCLCLVPRLCLGTVMPKRLHLVISIFRRTNDAD